MFQLIFLICFFETAFADWQLDCSIPGKCFNGPQYTTYGSILACADKGKAAITFDDGPDINGYSEYVLDALKAFGFRATFFTIGKKINGDSKYILQREIDEGHQVACHTYHHIDLFLMSQDEIVNDILMYEKNFIDQQFSGVDINMVPRFIRVPFFHINATVSQVLDSFNLTSVDRTLDTHDTDYLGLNTTIIMNYMQQAFSNMNLVNNPILANLTIISVQHDTTVATHKEIYQELQWLNDTFVSYGVEFVTISECLGGIDGYMPIDPRALSIIVPDTSKKPKMDMELELLLIALGAMMSIAILSLVINYIWKNWKKIYYCVPCSECKSSMCV
jgi:peptidoglycan/xylan/chitin deacetylase (PgdA/CDA1 family)